MAHLNMSFIVAQQVVEKPSFVSKLNKNKFAPLMSDAEFPELTVNSNSQNTTIINRPQTQFRLKNVNKKRKIRDTSPQRISLSHLEVNS